MQPVAGEKGPAVAEGRIVDGSSIQPHFVLIAVARAPILIVGLLLTGAFVVAASTSITTRWPITYPEGAHLAAVVRVSDGQPLYQDFRQYPYLITPYPPLMYLAGGLISELLRLGPYETLVASRVLTLAASLACLVLIGLVAVANGASRWAAAAGATLFLTVPFLDSWGYSIRPDVPAVALELASLWLVLRGGRLLWLAALVAAAGFFTKQTMVVLPVAGVLWLLVQGRRGDAVRFGAVWAGAVALGLGLLHLATGGTYLLNIVVAHLNPGMGLDSALVPFRRIVTDAWLPLGLAIVAVAYELYRRRRPGLIAIALILALALALYTLRGRGGDVNYLIEGVGLACVLAAGAPDLLWRWADRSAARKALVGAASLVLAVCWGQLAGRYWLEEGGVRLDRDLPLAEVAAARTVLAEEPTSVVLAGKPVVMSDPFHFSMIGSGGRYDPADMADRLKRHEFDLVIMLGDARRTRFINGQPKWPEGVRRAIADYYRLQRRDSRIWLYVPDRPRSASSSEPGGPEILSLTDAEVAVRERL